MSPSMNATARASAVRINVLMGTAGTCNDVGGGVTNESAVDMVAVQSAPTVVVAPTGLQVTGVESVVAPFLNCTVPVGPCELLLLDETVADRVTVPPVVTMVGADATVVVVVARVIVTATALLVVARCNCCLLPPCTWRKCCMCQPAIG